ncbi:hypothetical protein ACFQRC_09215 [Enterovirga sp. GCM10030262]|uniref:hypothetical protein n=1 Tax=Enterovirga sp. GCM10030262 TaxID=3273391 RepID=UPI00361BBDDC
MTRSPERLQKLLRQNQLKLRAAELVKLWSSHGVAASPVSHTRFWKLIDRLRGGRSWPLEQVDDLRGAVSRFAGTSDLITVMGWNVEEEPPLLMSTQALLRALDRIERVYPDGFILIDEGSQSALVIDIDGEEGTHGSRVDLPI